MYCGGSRDRWGLLGKGDDDCGLKAGGNDAVAEGKVGDGGENISQLVGAGSESPSRDVVWSSCLAVVDVPQNFMMTLERLRTHPSTQVSLTDVLRTNNVMTISSQFLMFPN